MVVGKVGLLLGELAPQEQEEDQVGAAAAAKYI